ncbi:hypothetical protein [Kangiella sp. HZ709]|uniref:hypothetical protein n=1 Tax=Kangiella sp. HZ709 TaxID=2666328 RepID=UPI0012AFB31A|nr:hypothetical protein [Kangiella sp. HZ709]MRX27558.1 hypothetical protein [Kangiella sp. HZ709]
MNKILISLLTLSIAGNAYLFFKPQEVLVETAEPEKIIVKETEVVSVKDHGALKALESANEKIAALENEMLKLQEELDLIKDREELAKLSKTIDDETMESIENVNVLSDETMKKMEQERQAMINLYEQEAVDSSWAYQTQDAITKALNESGDTSSYNVEDLQCKSTICKVNLKPYKQNEHSAVMAGISASSAIHMGSDLKGFDTKIKLDEKDGAHFTTMYLIKNK